MTVHELNLVPMWVLTLLFALVLLASMAAGMKLRRFVGTDPATVGSGQLIFGTMSILSLLLSMALFTIVDLDAPRWGSIQLNTDPMTSALRVIETSSRPPR